MLASALCGFARASGFLVTSGFASLRALLCHISSLGSVNINIYRGLILSIKMTVTFIVIMVFNNETGGFPGQGRIFHQSREGSNIPSVPDGFLDIKWKNRFFGVYEN